MPTDDLQESNYKDMRILRDFVDTKRNELNDKVWLRYMELFGSSPHNHSVRVDKDKLSIVADNVVVDEFDDWTEMEQWLKGINEHNEHNKERYFGSHKEHRQLRKDVWKEK